MTLSEAIDLIEYVHGICPQQAIAKTTPDAWHDILGDHDYVDCRAAARALGQRQVFIAPAEIRAEVQRIRNDRISAAVIDAPPADLLDDGRAYLEALRTAYRRAGDR
jgi:hypothetical protein